MYPTENYKSEHAEYKFANLIRLLWTQWLSMKWLIDCLWQAKNRIKVFDSLNAWK